MGKIHSIQSMATLDGPGVRFAVFLQGCNLRCGCCHNPDTWNLHQGKEISAAEIAEKAERYKPYFGDVGGITLSGGEPLLQADFAREVFVECKKRGMNTCLDTSGNLWNKKIEELLTVTDRVLLDIKYTTDEQYRQFVGCGLAAPLTFLDCLEERKIPTVVRQVIIPGLNDREEDMDFLLDLRKKHRCVEKIELLPFKKICKVKYDTLGLPFPFETRETPTAKTMEKLNSRLQKGLV